MITEAAKARAEARKEEEKARLEEAKFAYREKVCPRCAVDLTPGPNPQITHYGFRYDRDWSCPECDQSWNYWSTL